MSPLGTFFGTFEAQAGLMDRAIGHFIIVAECGNNYLLNEIKQYFLSGLVTKKTFEKALLGHQALGEETRSEWRERAQTEMGSQGEGKKGFDVQNSRHQLYDDLRN